MDKTWDSLHMGRSSIDLYANDIGAPFTEIDSFASLCRRLANQYQRWGAAAGIENRAADRRWRRPGRGFHPAFLA